MKSILPALISTCALVASTTPLFGASQGCVEDQRRSTELGHALGVLVYDSIIGEYAESVTVEDIAVGLKHASDRSAFQLSGIASIESNPDAGLGDSLSVSDARNIVARWRPQSDQLGPRFLSEYKQRGKQQKSGLMTHRWQLAEDELAQLAKCTANFQLPAEEGANQVCYLQMAIDSTAVCDMDNHVKNAIAGKSWTYGEFQQNNVIEGWVEVFKLLESEPLKRAGQSASTADTQGKADDKVELLEVLEVVIPSELAYGKKGMVGRVGPDETLWFLMAIK